MNSPWYGIMALSGEGCRYESSELATAGDFDDPAVASKGGGIGGNEVDNC